MTNPQTPTDLDAILKEFKPHGRSVAEMMKAEQQILANYVSREEHDRLVAEAIANEAIVSASQILGVYRASGS